GGFVRMSLGVTWNPPDAAAHALCRHADVEPSRHAIEADRERAMAARLSLLSRSIEMPRPLAPDRQGVDDHQRGGRGDRDGGCRPRTFKTSCQECIELIRKLLQRSSSVSLRVRGCLRGKVAIATSPKAADLLQHASRQSRARERTRYRG